MARHFPHAYPTFGNRHKPKPDHCWNETFYYWWWRYLRCNEDYIVTCSNDGKGRCAEIYIDFGDVRGDSFKEWWTQDARGMRLFSEPPLPDKERILLPGDAIPAPEIALTVTFPLDLSKAFMEKAFKRILKNSVHHQGRRGVQDSKRSQAKYQISGNPTIASLRLGLEVYEFKLANPELPLWKIGDSIRGVAESSHINGNETPAEFTDKKNVLAATASRYLRKTKQSIERVGQGVFP